MDKEQLVAIIAQCKKGDKQAFKQIMMHYSDYVFALAFRVLNNEEDAKDVVQETFIRVWQNLERYNEEIKLTTWMYKICTNLCFDKLKKYKRKPLAFDPELENIYENLADENIYDKLDNKQLADLILSLSENLTPKQKVVFVLRDIQDLETEEIVKITGMQKGQIKSNLYYARQQIRNKLIQIGYEVR